MATGKFRIEVRRNGTPIEGLTMYRTFSTTSKEKITLGASSVLRLEKDDKIEIVLVPMKETTDKKPRPYKIAAGDAVISIKKEPWF